MTEVNSPQGATHAGDGDLNIGLMVNNYLQEATKYLGGNAGGSRAHLRWLSERFVPPESFDAVLWMLREQRIVLLHGPVGSGRKTAAKMALRRFLDEEGAFTLLAEAEEQHGTKLTSGEVKQRDRMLLDLTHSGEEIVWARLRELPSIHGVLEKEDALLAVVLPDWARESLEEDLVPHVVEMDRPDARAVLQRHAVKTIGAGIPGTLQEATGFEDSLRGPMGDIAALVRKVADLGEKWPGASVEERFNEALSTRAGRRREVARDLQGNATGAQDRAVMLAAAMCEHALRDGVFFAAQQLFSVIDPPDGQKKRIEQDGYGSQLAKFPVDVGADGKVVFSKFGYAEAVRGHFWDNYPDLREPFRDWVDSLILLDWLSPDDCERVVGRYVEQALRTGHPGDVLGLIASCVDRENKSKRDRRMQCATLTLMAGLSDERHGQRFRELVRGWSREDDLDPYLARLVVYACSEVIALDFPEQAVVRLHHRARREGAGAVPSAEEVLRDLCSRSDRALHRFVKRLDAAFGNEHTSEDVRLFRAVVDPKWLTRRYSLLQFVGAESQTRERLFRIWRGLLNSGYGEAATRTLQEWLSAAGQLDEPELLLSTPLDAAGSGGVETLARVYVVARDWVRASGGDPRVGNCVSTLVDRAQGIDPADYSVQSAAEEMVP